MPIDRDHVFRSPEGLELICDIHTPEGSGPWPTVVVIHGGGWIVGDRSWYEEEARFVASQGFVAVNAEYRLAPLHPFPAAVADIQSLLRHLREIGSGKIGVLGNSAGGHLAAMAALCDKAFDGGGEPVRADAFAAISPITDLTEPRTRHFPVSWSFLEQFIPQPWETHPEPWRAASPITYAANGVPGLLIHGDKDDIVPVEQSIALHEKLEGSELLVLPGEAHAFTPEGWFEVRRRYVDFLRKHLV